MTVLTEKVKAELDDLSSEIRHLVGKVNVKNFDQVAFTQDYQEWYTKSSAFVKKVLPDRYQEFTDQYILPRRKQINVTTYTISDFCAGYKYGNGGRSFDYIAATVAKILMQITILDSAKSRIDSLLSNIEGVLQAQIFENEFDSATGLLKNGHLRAAGAIAGVVLEAHLGKVCSDHGIKLSKKGPTISDFNEALKKENVIDVPVWRHIQLLVLSQKG